MIYRDHDEVASLRARVEALENGRRRERRDAWLARVDRFMSEHAAPLAFVTLILSLLGGALWMNKIAPALDTRQRCDRVCVVHGLRYEWVEGDSCVCSGDAVFRSFNATGQEVSR